MLQFVCDVVKDTGRGIPAPVYSHWIRLDCLSGHYFLLRPESH